jgi:UDP-N-acetylglucosamine 2-epimerase (non-hydrolysing)
MTDSGGIQEETAAPGIPCFTIRENTERPVTIVPQLWDGKASERIVDILLGRPSESFHPQ